LDQAQANPGDDFFSALTKATFQGRPLTRDEMTGFANLTFAGGRDTIINSVTSILAFMAEDPRLLETLRANPKMILSASEEFVRIITPLTHTGRVCPVDTDVMGQKVKADKRISAGPEAESPYRLRLRHSHLPRRAACPADYPDRAALSLRPR
jgi:cytochrome P450